MFGLLCVRFYTTGLTAKGEKGHWGEVVVGHKTHAAKTGRRAKSLTDTAEF